MIITKDEVLNELNKIRHSRIVLEVGIKNLRYEIHRIGEEVNHKTTELNIAVPILKDLELKIDNSNVELKNLDDKVSEIMRAAKDNNITID